MHQVGSKGQQRQDPIGGHTKLERSVHAMKDLWLQFDDSFLHPNQMGIPVFISNTFFFGHFENFRTCKKNFFFSLKTEKKICGTNMCHIFSLAWPPLLVLRSEKGFWDAHHFYFYFSLKKNSLITTPTFIMLLPSYDKPSQYQDVIDCAWSFITISLPSSLP